MKSKLLDCHVCLPARQVARLLKKKQYNNLTIYQSKQAFTLIELLIVIALIGILSSFGVFSYQSSQKKARDSIRKSDLQQIKKALESSRSDCLGGTYYTYGGTGGFESTDYVTTVTSRLVLNKYIDNSPQDPSFNSDTGTPTYGLLVSIPSSNVCPLSTGAITGRGVKTYILRAKLEITNDPELASSLSKCQTAISTPVIIPSNSTAPASGDGYFYVCPD